MENATNFADAKDPNRRANYMKKLKKELKKEKKNVPITRAELVAGLISKAATPTPHNINDAVGGTVLIRDRRKSDRRAKPKTRMHFGTEVHTQWFEADNYTPHYEGRYKVKYAGAARFVFRYWNAQDKKWQFNRRKAAIECVQPAMGDKWCGLAAKQGL